ncbi:MAG TPA: MBL fold metallo-hydrolase [Bacteriovoracaceae bacterium]|nr:MBL fold metallo-hydrolase [Bacteriovoracaceae bacterium]
MRRKLIINKTNGLILMLLFLSYHSWGKSYSKSDHYDGEHFFNPDGPGLKGLLEVITWKWNATPAKWPETIPNKNYKLPLLEQGKGGIVTFINHATFLIQLPNLTLLTDPIFSQRAGPFQRFGPVKRVREPGVALDILPPIDVVVISHNHYDHMDMESLKTIDAKFKPLFLVPLGEEKRLKEAGLQNVQEMDWWAEQKVKEARITFTPVQHWSARGIFDKNESLWGGYFIDLPPIKIYFAGDTGYTPFFLQTKSRLGAPDIALLPIGAFEPRWFMKDHHMDPKEAVMAHIDLGSDLSFGMHFGTFPLTYEAHDQPLKDLSAARKFFKLEDDKFRVLDFGQSYSF